MIGWDIFASQTFHLDEPDVLAVEYCAKTHPYRNDFNSSFQMVHLVLRMIHFYADFWKLVPPTVALQMGSLLQLKKIPEYHVQQPKTSYEI